MKITCCLCQQEYILEDNIYQNEDKTDVFILICPHCQFRHSLYISILDFNVGPLKKINELHLKTSSS